MQSDALRSENSFEQGPKPSKHQFYMVFNDFHVNK